MPGAKKWVWGSLGLPRLLSSKLPDLVARPKKRKNFGSKPQFEPLTPFAMEGKEREEQTQRWLWHLEARQKHSFVGQKYHNRQLLVFIKRELSPIARTEWQFDAASPYPLWSQCPQSCMCFQNALRNQYKNVFGKWSILISLLKTWCIENAGFQVVWSEKAFVTKAFRNLILLGK